MNHYKHLAIIKYLTVILLPFAFNNILSGQSEFANGTIQIGMVASDFQKSLDFYINIIGMKKTGGFKIDENFGKSSGLTGGLPFEVTILKLEDSPQATELKLLSFNKKTKHRKSKNIQDDLGIQYITIYVKNLDPFLGRLKVNNIKLLGDTPVTLGDGRRFVLVQDPDGTFIELIER